MIARMWRGWVATERAAEYREYVAATGIAAYRRTPGNLDAQLWSRDLGDGRTEVTTVSWWTDLASIEAFAGADVSRAVFYPEDDRFLVDRETTVSHHQVA